MRNARLSLVLLLFALPAGAQAGTSRAALPSDSVPMSIRDAEFAGSRGVRATPNNGADSVSEARAIGTRERRCVDVDQINIARSGDFVTGPFGSYNELWRAGGAKIWWQPAVADRTDTLIVRASRLDGVADTKVFLQPFLTFPVDQISKQRRGPWFYPSGFRVPTTGRWLFVATAGPNWGCFVLTVR